MALLKIRDENGNIIEIPALKGDKGDDGKDGKDGADYILTDDDKSEIAAQVSGDCVSYSKAQALTAAQKQTARENIGAVDASLVVSSLSNGQQIPTAEALDEYVDMWTGNYCVRYDADQQHLPEEYKARVRNNIDAAKKTGDWEKLYEITTDGTVKKWEITTYSNGTDMALTSLGVKIIANNPLAEAPSNATITLSGKYIENGVEKLNVRVPIFNILSATENLVAVTTINNDRGIWLTKFCKAVANKASQTSEEFYIPNNMFTYNGVEYPILNTIVITGAVPLASGNTIEIWGIRA